MVMTIMLFLVGFVLITKGADMFINCTVEIGKKTNISELILVIPQTIRFFMHTPMFMLVLVERSESHLMKYYSFLNF